MESTEKPDHHEEHHHEIFIHIDHIKYEPKKQVMTGAQIRLLPNPPIGAAYDLWLETRGPGDDDKIADTQEVHLKSGMSFYSVLGKINPEHPMQLLEEDERYLTEKGYNFELVAEGEGGCLIIKAFALAPGKYERNACDLLICIPKGYNDAKLDNFYLEPALHLKGTDQYPQAANSFEAHLGRNWQRFSRHLSQWRAGIDTLQNFLPLVQKELQDKV